MEDNQINNIDDYKKNFMTVVRVMINMLTTTTKIKRMIILERIMMVIFVIIMIEIVIITMTIKTIILSIKIALKIMERKQ